MSTIIAHTGNAVYDAFKFLPRHEQDAFCRLLEKTAPGDVERLSNELAAIDAEYRTLQNRHAELKNKLRNEKARNATLLRQLRDKQSGKRGPYKPEQISQIRQLRQQGLRQCEIAEQLDMTLDAVKQALRRLKTK
jgi:hypothetical protein